MPSRLPTAAALLAAATALTLAAGCSRKEPPPAVTTPQMTPAPAGVPGDLDPAPTKLAGTLAPAPDGLADVVYLLPDGADRPGVADPLARELARQAMVLAAREEFGLRVGDASLGEPAPARLPADRHLRVRGPDMVSAQPNNWQVTAGPTGSEQNLWESNGPLRPLGTYLDRPEDAVATAERHSRGRLKECLAAARFEARPGRRSDAPVPAEVEKLLGEMRETSQFAAVRRLHREVRDKGESDALTAALARGYAHLALLTEFRWSPAPTAFKARALLHAQRLVARSPDSAAARWTRSYAAALAGLHRLALDDLAAAGKLGAADPKAAPPPWLDALDAYLHFDLGRLAAARARSDTPLARLLEYLAAEQPLTPSATIRAGRVYLADDPECYRVHDGQCRVRGVAHLHTATLAGLEAFAATMPDRVRQVPDLPGPAAAVLAGADPAEADLYAALRAAGDPASDRGEPTWAALAALVQDIRFTLSCHRLFFMGHDWAVPTGDAARELLPPLAGHPLRPLVENFTLDPRRDAAGVRRALLAAPANGLDVRAIGYYFRLRQVDPAAAGAWYGRALVNTTFAYREQANRLALRDHSDDQARRLTGRYQSDDDSRRVEAQVLQRVSPHAPLAAVGAVAPGPDAAARLSEVEKAFPGHAVVMRDLGRRHLADGRAADAVRCLERWIELSPDGQAYFDLADAYRADGDMDKWRKTLEASLEREDAGLDHARARVALADWHMARGEYDKAEPYATAAAETYAGWALLCAARCQEGLGKWDEAERIYRATAERYENTALEWYFASRLTGKMDPAAAGTAARDFVASLRGGVPPDDAFRVGRYYLLTGRPKEAREQLAKAAELWPTPYGGLFAALLADAAGDAAARDKALEAALSADRGGPDEKATAGTIRAWATQPGAPDAAAVEGVLGGRPPGLRADTEFFAGWLLANRGEKERARVHWERCVESAAGTRWLKTHARGFLDGGKP